jgi:hypothetical protein
MVVRFVEFRRREVERDQRRETWAGDYFRVDSWCGEHSSAQRKGDD